jgi:phage FluMu gp28-like protein
LRRKGTRVNSPIPRCFNSNELRAQWQGLREDYIVHQVSLHAKVDDAKGDTAKFLSEICHLQAFAYQLELAEAYKKNQFLAVRWPRQTGKSTLCGGLLTQDAFENPNLNIGLIGPSFRQTKLNLAIIARFCRNLPQGTCHIQKTRITFKNGSVIEAFPNNADTIRGHTFHRIWWDETNFTAGDEDLYDAILFTMGTTNGKLIASSTPFNQDSLFWRMCNDKAYGDFARLHFSWEKALAPQGPLNPQMIERIKRQFGDDPARWRREMEAEWAEDEDVWLDQSLIAKCLGTAKNCGINLEPFNPEKNYTGTFYGGLDLAQIRDYCVFCIIEKIDDKLYLRFLKIFRQPTTYAHVLGYIKQIQDRFGGFEKIRIDFTREGPSIITDMENAGIENAEGVNFTVQRKSEMASLLKQRMSNGTFYYPLVSWDQPYRGDICTELNVERFDLRKDGNIGYSHPNGTHDDVFWSIALAVYATVEQVPEQFVAMVPR